MKIEKHTLTFLSELAENNHRDWFEANRDRYVAAKANVTGMVNELIAGISAFDEGLRGLEAKHAMFRIFRDVRFSKNKAPYKTNMGAWMAPGGRKSPYAGYYLHVEPGGRSFIAGGSYMPSGDVLRSIRESVDVDADALRKILAEKTFGTYFDGLEGAKVKTAPKGYTKDHPEIDLLRHKSFVVSHRYTDAQVTAPDFHNKAVGAYNALYPLNVYLNRAIAEAVE